MNIEIFEPDAIDFYDWKWLEKLQGQRNKKLVRLLKKAQAGDEDAKKELKEHNRQERILKERANRTGYYWT